MANGATADDLPWTPARRRFGTGDVLAISAWTAVVAAFFWDAVSLRGALFYFDITELNYPYRAFLAEEWRAGRFSRWMPGLYCGLPLFSESQAGYLHPLKYFLYTWLPPWAAFNYDTILSIWLTGIGTYGWLRRHVGPSGALTGAGVFGLSGFLWAHLIHTSMTNALASVPFAFWALECAWDGGRLKGVALGAIAVACQVFAGHLQDTILTSLALGLYGLYRATLETGRRRYFVLGATGGMILLAGLLAAVQWVPSKELLDRSPRAGGLEWEDLTFGSWHPELLPTLLVREAYGTRARNTDWMDGFYPYHEMNVSLSALGIALAVIGAAAYRDRWVGFWVLLAGAGVWMMLGRYTFLFDFMHRLPVIGSARIPVRYHLWVSLAVAALAAVGVDRLARPGTVRLRWAALLLFLVGFVCVPILHHAYEPVWTAPHRWSSPEHQARFRWLWQELTRAVARTLVLTGSGGLVALVGGRIRAPGPRAVVAAALPLLVIADLLGAHWVDSPTVPPSYWTVPPESVARIKADPDHQRVFGLGVLSAGEPGYASDPKRVDFFRSRDTLAWSLPPVWGLWAAAGQTPIFPRRYTGFTDNVAYGTGRFDIEGMTHYLTGPGGRIPGWPPPEKAGAAYIHRNPNVLPRARLLGRPFYATGEDDAIAALHKLGPENRTRIIVEDPTRPLPPDAEPIGAARVVREIPERVEVETESADASYLFLSDLYDPGWTATVDGTPTPIRPAQVAFRAVYLPKGKHIVVFRYRPSGFVPGLMATIVGGILALGMLVWPRPIVTAGRAHGNSGWPRTWPLACGAVLLLAIAVSAVRIDPAGGVHGHGRWAGTWHRFTWGAKLDAMRPEPRRGSGHATGTGRSPLVGESLSFRDSGIAFTRSLPYTMAPLGLK